MRCFRSCLLLQWGLEMRAWTAAVSKKTVVDEDQIGTPLTPNPPTWFVVGCVVLVVAAVVGAILAFL